MGLSSNQSGNTKPSEGIYPGNLLPDIKNLENVSGTKINLSDLRGQKVLVNLWAAYDAPSRRDNVLLSNVIERQNYPVKVVSVSFDESESVFEKTLAIDKLNKAYQFWVDKNDDNENLYDRFQLQKGFKNYLIDESGKVIAMNLTPAALDQYFNRN